MINNLDVNSIFIYVGVIVVLFILAMAMKFKKSIVLKAIFNFALGAAFIYGVNAGLGLLRDVIKLDLCIPLNPVTAALVGYLQVPGIVLIYLIKYIIYPVA